MDIAVFYPRKSIEAPADLIAEIIIHYINKIGKPKFESEVFKTVYALLLAGI